MLFIFYTYTELLLFSIHTMELPKLCAKDILLPLNQSSKLFYSLRHLKTFKQGIINF